jgi:hypothetical protein
MTGWVASADPLIAVVDGRVVNAPVVAAPALNANCELVTEKLAVEKSSL